MGFSRKHLYFLFVEDIDFRGATLWKIQEFFWSFPLSFPYPVEVPLYFVSPLCNYMLLQDGVQLIAYSALKKLEN